ncbi:EXS family-domain-containing protein [Aspergillus pseudocaelatus]|uniref:EXS family-domain-containing protein n=1 Tax=Aspergillus pseudocaelatus TaxID=1825620 RepID=A0ABQ6WQ63_9EURO|nr:EXS family-domain-containing protein [Aspergillus pseudocaelatus]
MFLLGLFMWLNFLSVNAMYIYWPVVLIGITVIILFLPARILYHRSRKWWAYSNWRLLLAGLYPVEFRDFFLGDMYCSQTYAMGVSVTFFS